MSAQNPVYVLLIFFLICFLFIEDIFEDNFIEKSAILYLGKENLIKKYQMEDQQSRLFS